MFVDKLLNQITMYRAVLYYLILLLVAAIFVSFFHAVSYAPPQILFSALFLIFFCGFVNEMFKEIFDAPVNLESPYITAMIISLILPPAGRFSDFIFLGAAAFFAIASKHVLALSKKHVFNPAAAGVVLALIFFGKSANWWVGTQAMAPFVLVFGYLLTRKIQREKMVASFLVVAVTVTLALTAASGGSLWRAGMSLFLESGLLFLAFAMLTDPLTSPTRQKPQILYGALVGFLFAPQIHIAQFYSTPEVALLIGNLFAYFVSPQEKLTLFLKEKVKVARDIYDFVFEKPKDFSFRPGEYMEWTLPHERQDSRGTRRYFTLASSPTESEIRIGVKQYERGSSYKESLFNLRKNQAIVTSSRGGDFVLPPDKTQKLAFIAGGIGVTPFRSMIKYLIDKDEHRDIVIFYSNKTKEEIVYWDVFEEAGRKLNVKVIYTLTAKDKIPLGWRGEVGRLTNTMLANEVPDFAERLFYLSGPHSLVTGFENVLKQMGIGRKHIKTDFFPGFA